MESPDQRLEQVLETLRRDATNQPIGEQLGPDLPSLLGDPAIARALTARVAALDEAAVDREAAEQQLLHYLLDEARRDQEDDRPRGAGFLAAVGEALDGLDPQAVSDAGSVALARAYHRAGLAVPAAVQVGERNGVTERPATERTEGDSESIPIDVWGDPGTTRLERVFNHSASAAQWGIGYFGLHGYLFAIATHPQILPPSSWLQPLLAVISEQAGHPGEDEAVNDVLSELMCLYNRINGQVMDLEPALPEGCALRPEPVDNMGPQAPIGQWARGFGYARETFGHLADTSLEGDAGGADLIEGVKLVTGLIELLGGSYEQAEQDISHDATVEDFAALACEQLQDNMRALCAVRMRVRQELGDLSAGGGAQRARGSAEPEGTSVARLWAPQTILERLDEPVAWYQWEAMEHAAAQPAAITPLLLQRLEAVIADPAQWRDRDNAGLLYAMALLGYFGETGAHDPLLRLAALPEDTVEGLLGDFVSERLSVVLWQTSGGETAGLKELLENRRAGGYARAAAAEALGFGALFGDLDRREILAYLVALAQDKSLAEVGDPFWLGLLHNVFKLYPDEHESVLRPILRSENPDPLTIGEADLDRVLAEDRDTELAKQRRWALAGFPDDVHDYLEGWVDFESPDIGDVSAQRAEAVADPYGGFDATSGSLPGRRKTAATKPKGPDPAKKKNKRKQQKKARKANRKRK
jgi:hypothetical protein